MRYKQGLKAATFRWLCVETLSDSLVEEGLIAATFRWLCVETIATQIAIDIDNWQPPSGGCVLKLLNQQNYVPLVVGSHLQVAVC